MDRITNKQLEMLVSYLNEVTESPATPYTRVNDKLRANIGNYHISGAYGGVTLHRMMNEGGGVTTPLSCGYTTKRDLYNRLHTMIKGIETARELA